MKVKSIALSIFVLMLSLSTAAQPVDAPLQLIFEGPTTGFTPDGPIAEGSSNLTLSLDASESLRRGRVVAYYVIDAVIATLEPYQS